MFGKDESGRFPPVFYWGKWWACHVYASPCSGTGGDTIANHLRIYRFKGCFGTAFLVSLPFAPGSFCALPCGVSVQPAFLTTWRGEVGERTVRTRREPGGGKRREPGGGKRREPAWRLYRLLHPPVHETRPLRFTGRQAFLLERTRSPPLVFTNHETRNTEHGVFWY